MKNKRTMQIPFLILTIMENNKCEKYLQRSIPIFYRSS